MGKKITPMIIAATESFSGAPLAPTWYTTGLLLALVIVILSIPIWVRILVGIEFGKQLRLRRKQMQSKNAIELMDRIGSNRHH